MWDTSINATIILDNEHRFNDNPEYGKMMKRAWKSDILIKDCEQINSSVIQQGWLLFPKTFDGDTCYACPTNKECNTISAGNSWQI